MKRISRAKRYQRRQEILHGILTLITVGVVKIILNFGKAQNEYDRLTLRSGRKLNVPLERQLPNLLDGYKVTLLSILLDYHDINVGRLELFSNIKHVSSLIGNDYRGDPHVGFADCMSIENAGWCVYDEPLYDVIKKYIKRTRSYIGNDFVRVLKLVSKRHPIIITTTLRYDRVNDMRTWQTKQGEVNMTPPFHVCVVTGYSKKKGIVCVNDSYGVKDKKVSLKRVEASYNQQGK